MCANFPKTGSLLCGLQLVLCRNAVGTTLSTDMDLMAVIVEKVLLKVGLPELKLVESKLKEYHNCEISDCLYNPVYLKEILLDVFGDAYNEIIVSIQKEFIRLTIDIAIKKFLDELTNQYEESKLLLKNNLCLIWKKRYLQ